MFDTIILFSSDSNPQYRKDILNVIAAPYNGEYRFRYKTKYIDGRLISTLKSPNVGEARALIIFRTNSDQPDVKPFMVPIRWAKIKKVECIEEIWLISFIVKSYPIFSQDFKQVCSSFEANSSFSQDFFGVADRNKKYVLDEMPNITTGQDSSDVSEDYSWMAIIQALSHYEGFLNSFFFRTTLPAVGKKQFSNVLYIKENEYKEIDLVHYCADDTGIHAADVKIKCDTNILNPVNGVEDSIECRYDKAVYGFQAKRTGGNLKSRIIVNITRNDEKSSYVDETKIVIPVEVKRKWTGRIIRALCSFVGAACLAAVAIIPSIQNFSLPKFVIAILLILGAIGTPISWLISSEE